MVVIAVAGGTGGVGKTVVEKLVQQPKFQVIVLSRHVRYYPGIMFIWEKYLYSLYTKSKQETGNAAVEHLQIKYDDIAAMTRALENHNVHTIISAISLVSDETSQSQLNLIDAAENSKTTKRFIPSEYSFIQTAEWVLRTQKIGSTNNSCHISLLPIDSSIQYWLDAANRLQSSSLKYTRVIPGFFMDYWGMPHVQTHLQPCTFGINIAKRAAAIPGDGNDVICMTYTHDMTSFMVKLLDLDDWPEFSVVVGDEVTYNQILTMAEEITGQLATLISLLHWSLANSISWRRCQVSSNLRQCRSNQHRGCHHSPKYCWHGILTRRDERDHHFSQSTHCEWCFQVT